MRPLFRSSSNTILAQAPPLGFFDWGLVTIVCLVAGVGIGLLYSAAGGTWSPWAGAQFIRLCVGLVAMVIVAMIDVRFWLLNAYRVYAVVLFLLIVVEAMGHVGMGAQRWIKIGFFVLQPSELMKIALTLALARFFHARSLNDIKSLPQLAVPVAMVLMPVGLVLLQPNLGTATLLILGAAAVFWAANVRAWIFAAALALVLAIVPVAFHMLHDYQKERVYTFLDPSRDPWGAGYNILQSTIALGSGGITGKGFMQGTQSQLMFLPEKHTDFIFVVLAEEFGLIGSLTLIFLYGLVLLYGYMVALNCRHHFGRLVAIGITTTFFLYLIVNVSMVSGLIPVVGIPLPLLSYGGTALLTMMIGVGLLLNISLNREKRLFRSPSIAP